MLPLGEINLLLRRVRERAGGVREQGTVRVPAVEVLDRVPDRLRAAAQARGDGLAHLGERPAPVTQFACQPQDVLLLGAGQVAEPRPLFHKHLVFRDELFHGDGREAELAAAVHLDAAGAQPLHPPAGNRLRGDVESLAHRFEGEQRFDGLFDRDRRHRPIDAADEQGQIVPQVGTREPQVGVRVRPVVGDAEADVRVRVGFTRIDLAQQFLGVGDLGLPARRRRVPGLLLGQFLQREALELGHRILPAAGGCPLVLLSERRVTCSRR